jgi:hypothetical protein
MYIFNLNLIKISYLNKYILYLIYLKNRIYMGIGDWGLGIGDWGLGGGARAPTPKTPTPNPQPPKIF